jgi:hypothetical protein
VPVTGKLAESPDRLAKRTEGGKTRTDGRQCMLYTFAEFKLVRES